MKRQNNSIFIFPDKMISRLPILFLSRSGTAAILASALLSCAPAAMESKKPTAATLAQDAASSPEAANQKAAQSAATLTSAATVSSATRVQEFSVRQAAGQTVLFFKLPSPIAQFRHFPLAQPARILLDVFTDNKQAGEPETFRIGTNLVSSARVSSGEGYVRVALDIMSATVPPYTIMPEEGGVKITVGNADPRDSDKKTIDLVKAGKRVDSKFVDIAAGGAQTVPSSSPSEPGSRSEGKKNYTGQRLSLDFKDADIKNVFRLLAEVSGLNIVVTNDVNNKVTLRLVDVPWDQALDLLIDTNGLGREQVGNVVRISTSAQLKRERDDVAAAKRAEEVLEPLYTVYFNINYAKVRDLEPKVKTLQSKRADASLVIDERSNTLMVRDVKKAVDDVSLLIAKLDTRTPQVLIESNLIETTPTFARALGSRLQFTLGGSTYSNAAGAPPPYTATPSPFPLLPGGIGGTLSIIQNRVGGFQNLATALEAAESEGNIRILSRPSVVTLNNQPSTIRSERILRILLPASTNIASGSGSSAAGAAIATEKVPVGIILTVTPQVSSDGYVLMNINVKSSTLGARSEGAAIPDELNREAISNVLVRDGETIVLGGILKDTAQDAENGVPYIKDIPILGWLFKNHRWQKDFEELMVFITPRLTTAGSENLPTAEQLWRDQMRKTMNDQTPMPQVANP
jgi:type IV pilus assembly protein PilQ